LLRHPDNTGTPVIAGLPDEGDPSLRLFFAISVIFCG